MKKTITHIVFTLVFGVILVGGVTASAADVAPQRHQYILDFSLNTEEKILSGTQTVVVVNNSEYDWDKLCFRDYATALTLLSRDGYFDEQGTEIFYEPDGSSSRYSNLIDLDTGEALSFVREEDDPSIVYIPLETPLKAGEVRQIQFFYEAELFKGRGNLCWYPKDGELYFSIGNFYPILTCFEDGAWAAAPYNKHGECFYSPISDYQVSLRAPSDFVVAASAAALGKEEMGDGSATWTFESATLRDFALCASENFGLEQKTVDGITVLSYFPLGSEDIGQRNLEDSIKALTFFGRLYDYPYPYKTFSVAGLPSSPTGMEFPGLIMVNSSISEPSSITVVHEVAHQWFYGIVGSNSGEAPWLDEGMTTFAQLNYLAANDPEAHSYRLAAFSGHSYPHMLGASVEEMGITHAHCAYVYGEKFLYELRNIMGESLFNEGMNEYVHTYAMGEAHTVDFIQIMLDASGWDADVLALMDEYLFPTYTDMAGNPAERAVSLVSAFEIFNGTSPTTFTPDEPIDRAMAVTLLYRLSGCPKVNASGEIFHDVPANAWYYNGVTWATEQGVTYGVGAGNFAPTRVITVSEFQILLNRLGYTPSFAAYELSAPLLRAQAATVIAALLNPSA